MKLVDIIEHLSQQKIAGSKKAGVDMPIYWADRALSAENDKFSVAEPLNVGADTKVLDSPDPLKGK